MDELTLGNAHFLSATNPLATVDQRDLEALALRIVQTPEVQKAKTSAKERIKILIGRDATAEAWSSHEEALEEWNYHNALTAVNLDPNHPKVLRRAFSPPHEWFGMKVPGSRGFGGVNPDATYTVIPIDNHAHFEITGRRFDPCPVDVQFSLMGNTVLTMTLNNFEWQDMQFNPDNTFLITLDPEPANGRPNHIQTGPDTHALFIRDVREDWRQVPNAYRIKRLDPPLMPPLTFQQMVDRTVQYLTTNLAETLLFVSIFNYKDVDTVNPPFGTGNIGGLVTQMMSVARFKLADDEAFVVTIGSGGAKYHVLTLNKFWGYTLDFWNHTGSMNSKQSISNADGSTTYVISIKDPGVHNWLDTVSLHEPRLMIRWHLLPRDPVPGDGPWIKGQLVKLSDLESVLPAEMKWVTSKERKQQLAERLEMFRLRSVDC